MQEVSLLWSGKKLLRNGHRYDDKYVSFLTKKQSRLSFIPYGFTKEGYQK